MHTPHLGSMHPTQHAMHATFKNMLAISALFGAAMAFAAVDINQASEAELDGIKGFGPSTTAKIMAERQKAPFKDWADLMARIKGIRPTKAAQLSADGLSVNGAPYSVPNAAPNSPAYSTAPSAAPSSPSAASAASSASAKDR